MAQPARARRRSADPARGDLRSNPTFRLLDSRGSAFVLRRPPLGPMLESAHDVEREYRIISALAPTAVPVPSPLAYCRDPGVNGSPFYVMEFVDGVIARDETQAAEQLPMEIRRIAGEGLTDVLAELHGLDPDAIGLGDLGRREGYVARQLRRWQRQWEQSKSRDVPAVEEAHRLLESRVPAQQRTSIVHGDYRLDNVVIARDGSVAAVLDWELCTLGDPLSDLGMLAMYWVEPGEDTSHMLSGTPTRAGGFPSRDELLRRYAQRTGADLSQIDYFVALACWKLACIAEGIAARIRATAQGPDDHAEADRMTAKVTLLAEAALVALQRSV